jgi:hypothetical protein
MKGRSFSAWIACFVLAAVSIASRAHAATDQPPVITNLPPVVTVLATDPNGSEDTGDPATFQISRTGSTDAQLQIYYSLGGTARNGLDYDMLPGWIIIPAGASSAEVTIKPLPDVDSTPATSETVVLQLHPLVDIIPGHWAGYALGWPSNAVATLSESANPPPNRPPTVQLLSPANGAGYLAPVNLELVAQAQDPDGTVKTVEFFAATSGGTNSLGVVTNDLSGERFHGLYTLDWTNVPAADYLLTALATDNQGAMSTSAPVKISVLSSAQVPVVTVTASDANASELGPDTGTFTVARTGDTTGALAVYYSLSGTAQNGIDYQRLSGVVNIPAGAASADIAVTPIPDLDANAQTSDTVELQLQPLRDLRPGVAGLYTVGTPSNAVVTITEDATAFPTVTVTATTPNASEDGPVPGTFQVTRTGNTGTPLTVSYALGGTAKNGSDYQMLPGWVTFAAGAPTTNISVVPILDIDSKHETNETVLLQLRPSLDLVRGAGAGYGLGWPSNAVVTIAESANAPTNFPPAVRLVSPADGAGYVAPASISILAQASDRDGTVSNVQFFAATSTDTNSIGVVSNTVPSGRNRGLFSLNWTNVPVGSYVLTAVATDNGGAGATSGPVHVVVTQTALPTVSIFAPDPIASVSATRTNEATFVLRRSDGTNADLVVYYSISGTASNGVDYVTLPGSATIPAGHYTASVVIDPLLPASIQGRRVQTVTLTVQAPPTTTVNPPTYLVSRSKQATAVIVDSGGGNSSGRLGNGFMHVVLSVPQAAGYQLQVSGDLTNWNAVGSVNVTQGALQYVDPDSTNTPARFYRAVPDPSSDSD